MPFVGLGLHLLIAVYFAIHAVRTGQNLYWLIILLSFPLLGSLVYFMVIYLPGSRLERGARKAVAGAAKVLDPGRELREARAAFDYTPTAQNQMRLAEALLEAGLSEEAAANYENCLKGPFASDLHIRLGAARAQFACGHYEDSLRHLQGIRAEAPDYRDEPVSLLMARALAGAGRDQEARAEFERAAAAFGSFESKAEYCIWAATKGDRETAARLQADIRQSTDRWNRATRDLNMPTLRRLEAACGALREQA